MRQKSIVYSFQIVAEIFENSQTVFESHTMLHNENRNMRNATDRKESVIKIQGNQDSVGKLFLTTEMCVSEKTQIIRKIEFQLSKLQLNHIITSIFF